MSNILQKNFEQKITNLHIETQASQKYKIPKNRDSRETFEMALKVTRKTIEISIKISILYPISRCIFVSCRLKNHFVKVKERNSVCHPRIHTEFSMSLAKKFTSKIQKN